MSVGRRRFLSCSEDILDEPKQAETSDERRDEGANLRAASANEVKRWIMPAEAARKGAASGG